MTNKFVFCTAVLWQICVSTSFPSQGDNLPFEVDMKDQRTGIDNGETASVHFVPPPPINNIDEPIDFGVPPPTEAELKKTLSSDPGSSGTTSFAETSVESHQDIFSGNGPLSASPSAKPSFISMKKKPSQMKPQVPGSLDGGFFINEDQSASPQKGTTTTTTVTTSSTTSQPPTIPSTFPNGMFQQDPSSGQIGTMITPGTNNGNGVGKKKPRKSSLSQVDGAYTNESDQMTPMFPAPMFQLLKQLAQFSNNMNPLMGISSNNGGFPNFPTSPFGMQMNTPMQMKPTVPSEDNLVDEQILDDGGRKGTVKTYRIVDPDGAVEEVKVSQYIDRDGVERTETMRNKFKGVSSSTSSQFPQSSMQFPSFKGFGGNGGGMSKPSSRMELPILSGFMNSLALPNSVNIRMPSMRFQRVNDE